MNKLLVGASSLAVMLALMAGAAVAGPAEDFRSIGVIDDQPEVELSAKIIPLDVADEDAFADGVVSVGDKIGFELEGVEGASVYILNLATDGEVRMIYPNQFDSANESDGDVLNIPAEDAGYSFTVGGPAGIELVKVMVVRGDYSSLEEMLYQYFSKQEPFPKALVPTKDIAEAISEFSVTHGETQFVEADLQFEVAE